MGLETGTYVNDLVTSNPVASDLRSQGDDHLRLLKDVLKTTFPNATQAFRFPTAVLTKTTDYTVLITDNNCLLPISANGAARTITLPSADAGVTLKDGFCVWVSKTDSTANAVTISAAQNINTATTHLLRRQSELSLFIYNLADNQWYSTTYQLPFLTPPTAETADFTLSALYHGKLIRITPSAALTVVLPSTVPAGFKCRVVKTNSNAFQITLNASSGGNINGQTNQKFSRRYQIIELEYDGSTWWSTVIGAVGSSSPQGRLSLTTGVEVTTSDVTAATVIYYRAILGNTVPIYNTLLTGFLSQEMSSNELSLSLVSSHVASTAYDIFATLDPADGTTLIIGTGPAWSSSAAGSSSRGVGAGTTELTLIKGIYVNANSMTLRNGSTTYSIAANEATYLGSFRCSGSNGQTEDSKTNRLLWNLYNSTVRYLSKTDATATWNYTTGTWRQANAASGNQVNVFQGLVRDSVKADVASAITANVNVIGNSVGVGINSTTVNSANIMSSISQNGGFSGLTAAFRGFLVLGYNNINWLEIGSGSGTTTWQGTTSNNISGIVAEVIA